MDSYLLIGLAVAGFLVLAVSSILIGFVRTVVKLVECGILLWGLDFLLNTSPSEKMIPFYGVCLLVAVVGFDFFRTLAPKRRGK